MAKAASEALTKQSFFLIRMAKTVSRTDLGFLGNDFQIKLVKCFFEDQKFFIEMNEIIDQNMFTM